MKYQIIPVTFFQQNCTLLICETTNEAAVVDPGGDLPMIIEAVSKQGVTVKSIFLTHGHLDHVGATLELSQYFSVPIYGPHQADKFWIDDLPKQCMEFGFPECQSFSPTQWLKEGDKVTVGKETFEVIHCPGHTPGHVVFFHQPSKLALVGDVLFKGSIGRTDFPRGDYQTLINSITEKLWPLGKDIAFIPGHGPMSTFGHEMLSNPFVRVS